MAVTEAKPGFQFVDADGHVLEHPSKMLEYAPAEYRDRIWHVETDDKDREWVVWDGDRDPANTFALAGTGGMTAEEQARAATGELRYTQIRPGAFEPEPRLADLDTERITQTVLYPTMLLGIASIKDVGLAVAQCRAYNDWLSDFCSADPKRLFGIAVIPQQDVEAAAAEIERASKKPNLVGTFIRPNPVVDWKHLHDPIYNPMWKAASDAGWPIGLHPFLAGDVPGAVVGLRLNEIHADSSLMPNYQSRMNLSNIFYTQAIGNPVDMMTTLAFLLAGGVCERYPDLQIIVLETNGGWITPWMERLDHNAKTFPWDVPDCKLPPSEYFRRQCYISFDADEETLGLAAESPYVGDDRIIWASDYPHPDAKFPGTVAELLENIEDLDTKAQENIAWRNAQRLYRLPETPS
ncbi:MAG TPA: amidohydrolase family protein [Acidimicrobiia bacterium]|nr:amidohydrolase family protein [Acidimicrobiia bacterium]